MSVNNKKTERAELHRTDWGAAGSGIALLKSRLVENNTDPIVTPPYEEA